MTYLSYYLTGKAAAPLYYIVVLLQLTIITPWLVKIIKSGNKKVMNLLWLVTPIWLIYVYAWNFIFGNEPFLYGTLFPYWFIFYYLGLRVKCGMKFEIKPIIVLLVLIYSVIEALVLYRLNLKIDLCISQVTFGSYLYSFVFAGMLLRYGNKECGRNVLTSLGDCSYGIYFIHIFVLMIIGKLISIIGITNWYIGWIIRFILTLSISYFIVLITQKIFSKNEKVLRITGMK